MTATVQLGFDQTLFFFGTACPCFCLLSFPLSLTWSLSVSVDFVAALSIYIRRVVEVYSKGGLLTNDQPEAQRKLL
jgi:hypothetical protein